MVSRSKVTLWYRVATGPAAACRIGVGTLLISKRRSRLVILPPSRAKPLRNAHSRRRAAGGGEGGADDELAGFKPDG